MACSQSVNDGLLYLGVTRFIKRFKLPDCKLPSFSSSVNCSSAYWVDAFFLNFLGKRSTHLCEL